MGVQKYVYLLDNQDCLNVFLKSTNADLLVTDLQNNKPRVTRVWWKWYKEQDDEPIQEIAKKLQHREEKNKKYIA